MVPSRLARSDGNPCFLTGDTWDSPNRHPALVSWSTDGRMEADRPDPAAAVPTGSWVPPGGGPSSAGGPLTATEPHRRWLPGRPAATSLVRAAVAAAVFVLLFLLAAPRDPLGWEADVVDTMVDLPAVIGLPMQVVMQLGRRALVPAVGLAIYLVGRRVRPAVAVAVAGLVTAQTIDLLKDMASRPRPTGVPVRETADGFGFPSGHSAIAWSLAVVVATQLPPRWRWAPFLAAATVSVARVYVGVHYPLDVLGGAVWGLVVGWVVIAVADLRPSQSQEPH